MFHRRVDHARHGRVHAEDRFAGEHLGKVEQGIAFFPDVAPFGTLLERERDIFFFRNRKLGGCVGKDAIAEFAAAGAMHNEVGLGRAVFRGNAPLRSGGAD